MEYLALEQILKHLQHNRFEESAENIHIVYQSLVEISSGLENTIPLGILTIEQIMKFLSEHEHNLRIYMNNFALLK